MKLKRIIAGIFGAILSIATLASCNNNNGPTFIDYVHEDKNIRLVQDYKKEDGSNRDFYTDGISQVTLFTPIDGDTAHFKMVDYSNSDIIKSRFYGVDTPESTGKVEMWGHTASEFTKNKLRAAKTIVVSSTSLSEYKAPEADSTGSRYLSMIWISDVENAPYNELVLLNLWLVQEGLSYVKNVDEFPSFSDTFYAAEEQARANKLCLFSPDKEEYFNDGDYEVTSLLDIKKAVLNSINGSGEPNPFDNAKVRVRGTIAGYTNNILYLQAAFEDENTGKVEYAGVNIFTGMSSISSKYQKINTFIELSALAQDSENFGFQLTDVHGGFPKLSTDDPNDVKILYTPSEIPDEYKITTFDRSASSLAKAQDILFSPVNCTDDIVVTGGYKGSSGDITLYCKANGTDAPFNVFIPFAYTPDPENNPGETWSKAEDFVGHTFKLSGIYSFHKAISGKITYQVVARNNGDFLVLD